MSIHFEYIHAGSTLAAFVRRGDSLTGDVTFNADAGIVLSEDDVVVVWGTEDELRTFAARVVDSLPPAPQPEHEHEPQPQHGPPEGWAFSAGSRKAHYFRDDRSLCGRYGCIGLTLEPDNRPGPDDCTACRRRLEASR